MKSNDWMFETFSIRMWCLYIFLGEWMCSECEHEISVEKTPIQPQNQHQINIQTHMKPNQQQQQQQKDQQQLQSTQKEQETEQTVTDLNVCETTSTTSLQFQSERD